MLQIISQAQLLLSFSPVSFETLMINAQRRLAICEIETSKQS